MSNSVFTTAQIVDLVLALPSEQKKEVLIALAGDSERRRDERMALGEARLRALSAERGLDWDAMRENEREGFVNDLIHEDRQAPRE